MMKQLLRCMHSRVPVVGQYLSLLVVYIALVVAGLHKLFLQDKAIIDVRLCPGAAIWQA